MLRVIKTYDCTEFSENFEAAAGASLPTSLTTAVPSSRVYILSSFLHTYTCGWIIRRFFFDYRDFTLQVYGVIVVGGIYMHWWCNYVVKRIAALERLVMRLFIILRLRAGGRIFVFYAVCVLITEKALYARERLNVYVGVIRNVII